MTTYSQPAHTPHYGSLVQVVPAPQYNPYPALFIEVILLGIIFYMIVKVSTLVDKLTGDPPPPPSKKNAM